MPLWQAIRRCVAARPAAPVLFSPVSISAAYSNATLELIVQYLGQHRLRANLAHLITPRRPFRSRLTHAAELRSIAGCLNEIEDLTAPLAEIDCNSNIPYYSVSIAGLTAVSLHSMSTAASRNALAGLLIVDP